MKSRRKFTAEFKTQVALDAIKELESTITIGKKYGLHPNVVSKWKSEFLEQASAAFGTKESGKEQDNTEKQKLYEVIGQQKVEIDFLKQALSKIPH